MTSASPDLDALHGEVRAAEGALTRARLTYLAAAEGHDDAERADYLAAAARVEAAHDALALAHLGDAQPLVMTLTPGSDEVAARGQWQPIAEQEVSA